MNRENLIRLRDELIPSLKKRKAKLDLANYRSTSSTLHVCNTAACLVGFSSELISADEWDDIVIRAEGNIIGACNILCDEFYEIQSTGHETEASIWEFIFGPNWPNSFEYAVDRINYVLDNNTYPDYLDMYAEYLDFPWDYKEYLLNNPKTTP